MIKKLLVSALAAVCAMMIGFNPVSAYSEIGSICVSLKTGVEGTSINGVEFELIQVGNVVDGLYEYTEDFLSEKSDLNKIEKANEMEELAIRLDQVANEKKIIGTSDKTDNNGKLIFDDLEVGIYLLKVSDYAKYEYIEPTLISIPTYNEESQNSTNFDVVVIPKHTPFKVSVSKQDITTQKELEGAELQVTDKDGNIVDKWVSGKEPHMIQNLFCGQTYTITETIAPDGYKIAQSINFTVDETGEVQRVIMYDELLPTSGGLKTGDDSNISVITIIAILSGLSVITGLYIYSRKRKYE
ncbi:hypothetical protein IMSAGC017_01953 [Thomasclavelia cocleata]|uniref:SpaA-like prealbumin fold domain-containing protein n=1 Tax=Thomasclavelia cocleata TaxID=69824 RepID=A0A829ZD53_9FIRM|nr:SpaA isopeptide-forming pilin-related protein [Thomasclavelia cocleata]GFI41907.1 hypothetical protein IMSAGC017_01953 [Thomasclavelia cocleata]